MARMTLVGLTLTKGGAAKELGTFLVNVLSMDINVMGAVQHSKRRHC